MKYSDNEVYALYGCKEPTYGDPFFLTSEERNILYDADLSDNPKLAVIRDIFVFATAMSAVAWVTFTVSQGTISRTVFWNPCRRRRRNVRRRPSGCRCTKGVEDTGTIRCQFRQTVPFRQIHTYNLAYGNC